MAGDWIKLEHTTPDKPEVYAMAETLGIDPDAVLGKLCRLWIWADQQTYDGNARSVTRTLVDRVTGVTGFCDAACSAGWIVQVQDGLLLPNFERHNGQTAKSRALTTKRVSRHRENVTEAKRNCNAQSVTEELPEKRREEKRREESKTDSAGAESCRQADDIGQESDVSKIHTPEWLVELWNETAEQHASLKTVRKPTKTRLDKSRRRLREPGWVEAFTDGLDKLPIPNNERFDWQPTFDWLVENDTNAFELAEGKFDKRAGPVGNRLSNEEATDRLRQRLERMARERQEQEADK